MAIRPRGASFEASLMNDGKRIRKSFPDSKSAEIWEAEMTLKLVKGIPIDTPVAASAGPATLRALLNKVFEMHWKGSKSEFTVLENIKIVQTVIGPDYPVRSLSTHTFDLLIEKLKEKGNGNGTINRKIALLSKAMRFASDRGWLTNRPVIHRLKENKNRIRYLTPTEEATVLRWFTHAGLMAMNDLVIVLVDTGARLSEVLRLRPIDIDHKAKLLTFNDTKNGETRSVPMTARVSATLKARTAFVGPFEDISRYAADRYWSTMRASIGLSGDEQFVVHALRHTCASRLIQRGIALPVVMQWLGHKSLQMTLRYAHLMPKQLFDAAHVLEPDVKADTISVSGTVANSATSVAS